MTPLTTPSKHFNFLDLSTSNVLEKNIRSLIENVDELTAETNKFINYHKQLQKANHQKQQLIQKRVSPFVLFFLRSLVKMFQLNRAWDLLGRRERG